MADCKTCKIYKEIKENNKHGLFVCCAWYMDNVICGDKSMKDCPNYKKR